MINIENAYVLYDGTQYSGLTLNFCSTAPLGCDSGSIEMNIEFHTEYRTDFETHEDKATLCIVTDKGTLKIDSIIYEFKHEPCSGGATTIVNARAYFNDMRIEDA